MDINRFTEKSQEALRAAQSVASRRNHQGVDVEHLLLALLEPKDGLARAVIQASGVDPNVIDQGLGKALEKIPQVKGPAAGPEQIYITNRLNQVLQRAEDEAKNLKDEYVSVEHLLLAALEGGEQQVLDADVFVLEVLRLIFGTLQDLVQAVGDVDLFGPGRRSFDLGDLLERLAEALVDDVRVDAAGLDDGARQPVFGFEQREQQMLDVDTLMIAPRRDGLRRAQCFL